MISFTHVRSSAMVPQIGLIKSKNHSLPSLCVDSLEIFTYLKICKMEPEINEASWAGPYVIYEDGSKSTDLRDIIKYIAKTAEREISLEERAIMSHIDSILKPYLVDFLYDRHWDTVSRDLNFGLFPLSYIRNKLFRSNYRKKYPSRIISEICSIIHQMSDYLGDRSYFSECGKPNIIDAKVFAITALIIALGKDSRDSVVDMIMNRENLMRHYKLMTPFVVKGLILVIENKYPTQLIRISITRTFS
ncbi:hypothetical protein RF11_06908 [Thelohanellus kitauei]|uniref:Metaxin glutathione S-transferase domain-containing protein n=1 Tax=Thelohanellus kitauei TaxID=669202 RepID=A0A0C2N3K8_THEKT|nr:hypothetical protein RF11_06908 [Thelohanellus kitauei]